MATYKNDSLIGKADGKIYFIEGETGDEYCISDELKFNDRLVELCRAYIRDNCISKREYNV
jgi:hypothetical protein